MGTFFSNLHIKKTDGVDGERVRACMLSAMAEQGYRETGDRDSADGELTVFVPNDGRWISVCSDLIEFGSAETVKAWAEPLSEALGTDVLAAGCFDSDYLFLNLVNRQEGLDAWQNIGKWEGRVLRRGSAAAWKTRVPDLAAFRQAAKDCGYFAEEFMGQLETQLGLPLMQGTMVSDMGEELAPLGQVITVSLVKERSEGEREAAEPPKLRICGWGRMLRHKGSNMNQTSDVSFYNCGGASRGLTILFSLLGTDVDGVWFEDVTLNYEKSRGKRVREPIELEKCTLTDGRTAYFWQDPNFRLQEKVSPDLSPSRQMEKHLERAVYVQFLECGNRRRFLDVTVTFVPMENPVEGQASHWAWMGCDSRAEYIEQNNQHWKDMGRHGGDPSVFILDPADYDL